MVLNLFMYKNFNIFLLNIYGYLNLHSYLFSWAYRTDTPTICAGNQIQKLQQISYLLFLLISFFGQTLKPQNLPFQQIAIEIIA